MITSFGQYFPDGVVMIECKGYAAYQEKDVLKPFSFIRRDLNPDDVLIDINYCGICHSDLHQVANEWGHSVYPMVPGHEVVGVVSNVGSNVSNFKKGDTVGVGCLVNSCQACGSCHSGLEQYCETGYTLTYNSYDPGMETPTYGGYSNKIVVDKNFVLSVNNKLELSSVAPLLCAGITTYSPLKYWGAGPGVKVGVIGLGGLGHMAIKIAKAMGAEIVLFTTSKDKRNDAIRLGASKVIVTTEDNIENSFYTCDLIINTVANAIDLNPYLNCLKREGTLVLLGIPEHPTAIFSSNLILKRRKLAGSLIGGIEETQEMLDFCAEHNIVADVEVISADKINEAYSRVINKDVKYRFVIDMNTLAE